jgi:uncharacterized protein (DUF302 family)
MRSVYLSNLAWGLYGLFMGAGITLSAFLMLMHGAIITEQRSPYDFATTVQVISTNAANRGWKVSRVEDFGAVLAQGEDLNGAPVEVIELCHPDYARQILNSGKPSCLAMMPCSVAVYEREGHVYVASLNRGLVGRFFRLEAASVLRKVRADEKEILRLAAKR